MKVRLNLLNFHKSSINNHNSRHIANFNTKQPALSDSFSMQNNSKISFGTNYGIEKYCLESDIGRIQTVDKEILQIKLQALEITKRAESASIPQSGRLENRFVDGENQIYEDFLFSTDGKLHRYTKMTTNSKTHKGTSEKFSFVNGYDLRKYEKTVRIKDAEDEGLEGFVEQRIDFCDDCTSSKTDIITFLPTCTKTEETCVSFDENCDLKHYSHKNDIKVNRNHQKF